MVPSLISSDAARYDENTAQILISIEPPAPLSLEVNPCAVASTAARSLFQFTCSHLQLLCGRVEWTRADD